MSLRRMMTVDEIEEQEAMERESLRQSFLAEWTTWHPISEEEVRRIATGEITRPEPTIWQREDGVYLLYEGRIHMFAGPTESCKTWAALEVMAQELSGGHGVIYVDIEDEAYSAIGRLLELGVDVEDITEGFIYLNPIERWDDVAATHLEARVKWVAEADPKRPVRLAVLDSVTEGMSLQGLDPDRGTDVADFYKSSPGWFTQRGMAVVLVDHVPKAEGARTAIGSERKRSGLTGASYSFSKEEEFGRGRTGEVRVTIDKDRPGAVRPYCGADGSTVGTMILVSDDEADTVTITLTTRIDCGGRRGRRRRRRATSRRSGD